jgi:NTE family protein
VKAIGFGAVSIAMVTAFWWRCRVAKTPLLDLAITRIPTFTSNAVSGAFQQVGFFGWFLTGPLIMTSVWGWSVRQAGFALALSQVMASIGSPIGGQLVSRFGHTPPIVVSSLITAVGSTWLLVTATTTPNFWGCFLPAALVMGFGSSICGTMTTGAALASLPQSMLGAGNSLVQLVRRIGGAVGVALAVALLGEGRGTDLLPGARRVWMLVTVIHIGMGLPLWWASAHRRHEAISRMVT